MKIGIDFVNTNLKSGSKTYSINFLNALLKINIKNEIYIFLTNSYFKELKNTRKKNIKFVIKPDFFAKPLFKLLWVQIILPIELIKLRVKKIFSPGNICPIIARKLNIEIILGLHSNLPWKYFNLMPGNTFKKYLIKKMMEFSIYSCDTLIVNSQFAKNEIKKILSLRKKIKVIYLGIKDEDQVYNKKIIKDKFFLTVTSCVRYKNNINILKAINNIKKKTKLKFYLIMQILDKKYFSEIKELVRKNKLSNKVKIKINPSREEIFSFYKNANFYIYTSYCEVFGLTTLEAMSKNIPVLVSNSSALKEINGDAADYFDPNNIKELENKIIKISTNKSLREKLIKRSKKKIKIYNWRKTAFKTLKILNNI